MEYSSPSSQRSQVTLAVIIPVHNGGKAFRQCLEAITAATPPPSELFVVVDGVNDGSEEVAEAFGATVLTTDKQSGPARARNLGAQHAQSDLLLFLDADTLVPSNIIQHVTEIFHQAPQISAVIGSYDAAPGAPNFLSKYRNLLHHFVHQSARSEGFTFWGACGAIRRDVFLRVGGFDTKYVRPSVEDIELGYRLRRAGHRIRLEKGIHVKHLKEWRVGTMIYTDIFRRALPWTSLILESKELTNDLNLRVSSRLSVMLVCALLGALASAFLYQYMIVIALISAILLMGLNADLYRFFVRARGVRFALMSIPWHWLFYMCAGVGFALGLIQHVLMYLNQLVYQTRTSTPS